MEIEILVMMKYIGILQNMLPPQYASLGHDELKYPPCMFLSFQLKDMSAASLLTSW